MNASELNDLLVQLNFCNSDYTHADYDTFENSIKAIEQLIKERDEARREVCKKLHRYPEYIAECRGWDCYKEKA